MSSNLTPDEANAWNNVMTSPVMGDPANEPLRRVGRALMRELQTRCSGIDDETLGRVMLALSGAIDRHVDRGRSVDEVVNVLAAGGVSLITLATHNQLLAEDAEAKPDIRIMQGPKYALAEGASRRNGSSQILKRLGWEWQDQPFQGFATNEEPLSGTVDRAVEELRNAGLTVELRR